MVKSSICLFVLILSGCAAAPAALSIDQCEVISSVLPEYRAPPDQGLLAYHVSNSFGDASRFPEFEEIVELGFVDGEIDLECVKQRGTAEDCFKVFAEYSLDIDNWPASLGSISSGTLSDCDEAIIGPEVTSEDWNTIYSIDGLPSVTGLHLFTVNRAVISKDRQRAIVTMEYTCGGLCGEGYSLLLQREVKKWRVMAKRPHWIS